MNLSTTYLPPSGKYRPIPIKDISSCGYPWQHNPLLHKATSQPYLCRARNVFRIYQDNKVFYTRTNQQVADGLHTYYLYDEQGRITETGEVAVPMQFTDDNWYQYPYKPYALQAAYIRSLGGRTNVMVATYQQARTTAGGEPLCFHPIKSIRSYALIAANTPLSADGHYITTETGTQHNFTFHGREDVEVSITHYQPVAASPSPQPHNAPAATACNAPAHVTEKMDVAEITIRHRVVAETTATCTPAIPVTNINATPNKSIQQLPQEHYVMASPLSPPTGYILFTQNCIDQLLSDIFSSADNIGHPAMDITQTQDNSKHHIIRYTTHSRVRAGYGRRQPQYAALPSGVAGNDKHVNTRSHSHRAPPVHPRNTS